MQSSQTVKHFEGQLVSCLLLSTSASRAYSFVPCIIVNALPRWALPPQAHNPRHGMWPARWVSKLGAAREAEGDGKGDQEDERDGGGARMQRCPGGPDNM